MSGWRRGEDETKGSSINNSNSNSSSSSSSNSYCIRSTSTVRSVSSSSSEWLWRPSSSSSDVCERSLAKAAGPSSSSSPTLLTPETPAIAHLTPSTSPTLAKLTSLPANAVPQIYPFAGGFKHYGPRMRLYCRTGFCVIILTDGKVVADPLGNHTSGVLEFTSAGIGEVRIRGVESNLYLAMNQKGNLYGEEDPSDYATVFVERTYGQYNTYLSQKYAHRGWYVGIKKNGAIKKASQTKWGQKAIQFLPLRTDV